MRAHFGGSSRQSLVVARAGLDRAIKGGRAQDASTLCTELFVVAGVLNGAISLRRAITDPSRDAKSKSVLVSEVFGKTLGKPALGLITEVSGLRWSSPGDLVPVLEQLAIEAQASSANIDGELDRVENEFFAVSRAIGDSFELRKALITVGTDAAKEKLIQDLLGKTNTASTTKLVNYLVKNLRGRSIEAAFDDYSYALAVRRDRVIALVRVAAEISTAQRERLVKTLTKQVGQPVSINIEIDSTIVGGISVKFGDELVDGTMSNRLAGAGRMLAGQKN